MWRKCRICKEIKSLIDFPKRTHSRDGIRTECKNCNSKYKRIHYIKNGLKFWAQTSIYKHRKKGYKISLTIDEVCQMAKISQFCQICGIKLDWKFGTKGIGKNKPNSPSIDRINNEKELRKDNIMIICRKCNSTKSDRTFIGFINYCKLVVDKFGMETLL